MTICHPKSNLGFSHCSPKDGEGNRFSQATLGQKTGSRKVLLFLSSLANLASLWPLSNEYRLLSTKNTHPDSPTLCHLCFPLISLSTGCLGNSGSGASCWVGAQQEEVGWGIHEETQWPGSYFAAGASLRHQGRQCYEALRLSIQLFNLSLML